MTQFYNIKHISINDNLEQLNKLFMHKILVLYI
jgi:hypothetical protein